MNVSGHNNLVEVSVYRERRLSENTIKENMGAYYYILLFKRFTLYIYAMIRGSHV